jgi:hypothetical protein
VRVSGWEKHHFPDADQLFFYTYGFVSDKAYVSATRRVTREYGYVGWWFRPLHDLECMNHACNLKYDGEEDGMFRYSEVTMLGQEIFRLFEMEKLKQRFTRMLHAYHTWAYFFVCTPPPPPPSCTIEGFVNQVKRQYALHGAPHGFIGYTTFANSYFGFSATIDQVGSSLVTYFYGRVGYSPLRVTGPEDSYVSDLRV